MKQGLSFLLGTDTTIRDILRLGWADMLRNQVSVYGLAFDLDLYSSDGEDYSSRFGVRHHPCGPRRELSPWLRHAFYYRQLLRSAPNMRGVIRTTSPSLAVLPELKRRTKAPAIVDVGYDWAATSRRHYPGWKRWLAPWMQRRCLSAADLLVATTKELGQRFGQTYGKRVVVIPNFVNTSLFRPGIAREQKIVYAGRLHWAKGVSDLLEAYDLLALRCPEVRLILLGGGEEEAEIRRRAGRMTRGRVEFLGSRDQEEVARHLGTALAAVLPTRTSEGHPRSVIEAMACGTPVVSTDVPGIRDLVRTGENGLLVPPESPAALASALERICLDRELWSRLSANCLRSARTYDKDRLLRHQVRVMRVMAERRAET